MMWQMTDKSQSMDKGIEKSIRNFLELSYVNSNLIIFLDNKETYDHSHMKCQ